MKYFVRVGETEHEVVFEGDQVTVDGEPVRAGLDDLPGTPVSLVTIGTEVHRVLAGRGDTKGRYTISIGGFRIEAEALDERVRTIRRLSGTQIGPTGPVNLHAPMPGLIVRVNVVEGDVVQAGQGLVVIEAMKMENELRAGSSGRVKRVAVSAGGAVEKGALLLEIEQ